MRTKTKTFVLVLSLRRAVLSGSTTSRLKIFINFPSEEGQGSINCFIYEFLILLGRWPRSWSMRGLKITTFGMLIITLVNVSVFTAIWVRLNNTHVFGHCVIFWAIKSPPTSKSEGARTPLVLMVNVVLWPLTQFVCWGWFETSVQCWLLYYDKDSFLLVIHSES